MHVPALESFRHFPTSMAAACARGGSSAYLGIVAALLVEQERRHACLQLREVALEPAEGAALVGS